MSKTHGNCAKFNLTGQVLTVIPPIWCGTCTHIKGILHHNADASECVHWEPRGGNQMSVSKELIEAVRSGTVMEVFNHVAGDDDGAFRLAQAIVAERETRPVLSDATIDAIAARMAHTFLDSPIQSPGQVAADGKPFDRKGPPSEIAANAAARAVCRKRVESRAASIERVVESFITVEPETTGTVDAHMANCNLRFCDNVDGTERKLYRVGSQPGVSKEGCKWHHASTTVLLGTFTAEPLDAEWKWEPAGDPSPRTDHTPSTEFLNLAAAFMHPDAVAQLAAEGVAQTCGQCEYFNRMSYSGGKCMAKEWCGTTMHSDASECLKFRRRTRPPEVTYTDCENCNSARWPDCNPGETPEATCGVEECNDLSHWTPIVQGNPEDKVGFININTRGAPEVLYTQTENVDSEPKQRAPGFGVCAGIEECTKDGRSAICTREVDDCPLQTPPSSDADQEKGPIPESAPIIQQGCRDYCDGCNYHEGTIKCTLDGVCSWGSSRVPAMDQYLEEPQIVTDGAIQQQIAAFAERLDRMTSYTVDAAEQAKENADRLDVITEDLTAYADCLKAAEEDRTLQQQQIAQIAESYNQTVRSVKSILNVMGATE